MSAAKQPDRAAMLSVYGGTTGRECIGFLLRTAKGVRAFGGNNQDLGIFTNEKEAANVVTAATEEGVR